MKRQQFYFVTDLHGKLRRYDRLIEYIEKEPPEVLFIGGDFLPSHVGYQGGMAGFLRNYLREKLFRLKNKLRKEYPLILLIFGNDDPRALEKELMKLEEEELLNYIHNKSLIYKGYHLTGYAYIPPTPFHLKDWERYDVSRYVDPGCVPPEEGRFSLSPPEDIMDYTIEKGLKELGTGLNHRKSIWLMHSPPYKTKLDRAALDGIKFDHVPLDVHVGSIAISRFIDSNQPLITLHGHIHESPRITGDWKEKIGKTWCFSAALEGYDLALVKFDPAHPEKAERIII
jgi:uncharacterized protein